MNRAWEVLISVAEYAVDEGEFTTPMDVIRFFEKPDSYEELQERWVEDQQARAEDQAEMKYRAP